ncbi:MAG: DUF1684 domain-containing protein [Anaerolineales bacterium]
MYMAQSKNGYIKDILKQRKEREDRFRESERGWLGLVGLYWLRDGENRIGNDPSNDIVLPSGPPRVGVVQYNNGVATFRAQRGVPVRCNDKVVSLRTLNPDISDDPDFLQVGDLTLLLLERADRHLIRVWDKNSPARKNFSGFNQFEVDPAYCIDADYVSYHEPKMLSIKDVIEIYHEVPYQGYVEFELAGKKHKLEATAGEDYLFFSFKDKTSGNETYVGGRYLVTDLPKDGKVTLDFNLAYNPPCAYTDFATCPLPPSQNILDVAIEAGEKTYREEHDH